MAKTAKEIEGSVNSRSNKSDIQNALNDALKALKEQERNSFEPDKIKRASEVDKLLVDTAKIVEESIKSNNELLEIKNSKEVIESLAKRLQVEYDIANKAIMESNKKYLEVDEAITEKEKQLKELFGVEEVLVELSTLIDLYHRKEIELEARYKDEKNRINAEIDELKEKSEETLAEINEKYRKLNEEEEYKFDRNKRIKMDKLDDDMHARRKIFNEELEEERKHLKLEIAAFEKQKDALYEEEKTIEDLNKTILELTLNMDNRIKEAALDGEAKAKKSFNYEVALIKSNNDGTIKLLNNKIDLLNEKLEESKDIIKDLNKRLEAAQDRVNMIANKSMETASDRRYAEDMKTTINNLSAKESK